MDAKSAGPLTNEVKTANGTGRFKYPVRFKDIRETDGEYAGTSEFVVRNVVHLAHQLKNLLAQEHLGSFVMECQRVDEDEVMRVLTRPEFKGKFATKRSAYWTWFAFVVRGLYKCLGKDSEWVDKVETKFTLKNPVKTSAPMPAAVPPPPPLECSSIAMQPLSGAPPGGMGSSSSLSSPYSMTSPVPVDPMRATSEDEQGWVVEMEGVDQAAKFPAGAAPLK
jgi:hypothetical protein